MKKLFLGVLAAVCFTSCSTYLAIDQSIVVPTDTDPVVTLINVTERDTASYVSDPKDMVHYFEPGYLFEILIEAPGCEPKAYAVDTRELVYRTSYEVEVRLDTLSGSEPVSVDVSGIIDPYGVARPLDNSLLVSLKR